MATVELSTRQQQAFRSLGAAEPVPGTPLPDGPVLRDLTTLLRCDGVHVALTDLEGCVVQSVQLPRTLPLPDPTAAGPPSLGLRWAADRFDVLVAGFPSGPAHRVELTLVRHGRPFGECDVAVLRLVEPVVARLFREAPTPHLPGELTAQERRVLQLVADGGSNAEIAERMGIAPSTVRKHLEHAFPKLGVSNRLGAALAFEGRTTTDPPSRSSTFA